MKASIMMTYRAGAGPERHANLLSVLDCLAQSAGHEVIVVEQDVVPNLTQSLPHPHCRVVFAYNPGPFNKSWGFNIGIRVSSNPVLVFSDADILAPGLLDRCIDSCLQTYPVVKPYRRIVDLTPAQSEHVRAGNYEFQPPPDAAPQNREGKGEHVVLCGGLFVIRRTVLRKLGGWDERFRGWGGEDDAMTHVLQRAQLPMLELDERPALHLWHPRSIDSTDAQPHYRDNCQLVTQYQRYSKQALARLAEVNLQVMGNRHKYRPRPEVA